MGLTDTGEIHGIIDSYFYSTDSERIYDRIIEEIEKAVIIKALERAEGNQIAAAKILGMHRNTLGNKIKKLSIDTERYKK